MMGELGWCHAFRVADSKGGGVVAKGPCDRVTGCFRQGNLLLCYEQKQETSCIRSQQPLCQGSWRFCLDESKHAVQITGIMSFLYLTYKQEQQAQFILY